MANNHQANQDACSVTHAMSIAKEGLEQIHLTVVGEVSEFNDKPGYKAAYFTIRDESSSMSCLMWRNVYNASGISLKAGMLVEVTGKFSCYPARGTLQFSVSKLTMAGEGSLRLQVAALANKLRAQGLMDEERKRKTPALPQRIALVTSPRGKAVHDVLRTLRKRYPLGEIFLYGVTVEGETAPASMSEALYAACEVQPQYDVILLVRGGGSYESLMPFNDEGLARVIASCSIPVVTGIGHEPDNTIADMVADKRCSTPTAAAAAIAPAKEELAQKLNNASSILNKAYKQRLDALRFRLERLSDRQVFQDEYYLLGNLIQTIDILEQNLKRALPNTLLVAKQQLDLLEQQLAHAIPNSLSECSQILTQTTERLKNSAAHILDAPRKNVQEAQSSLQVLIENKLKFCENKMSLNAAKLEALSPIKTLARGYSITYAANENKVIDSVKNTSCGEQVSIRLRDGRLGCSVTSIERQKL